MNEKYYHIEINRFNKNGFGEATWGLYAPKKNAIFFLSRLQEIFWNKQQKNILRGLGKRLILISSKLIWETKSGNIGEIKTNY